ncbi:DUF4907 domain-containing protein [Flagellimonas sediminis]|uniref:DUF4907 domain-containing protein n=1 Tax=Flagellimonas sediminis TaxID=2696468 RepID=A0A6I5L244_9FLAO|nr:DUF4907 domain-containing protein [Allomuricauda sediminis]NDV43801.1 DUF4907 domain-containing protein [Allomuricauda sediminis]
MKNITKLIATILTLGLFLYGATHLSFDNVGNQTTLRKEIIKVENGYGYQIFSGEKLLVQQKFIPAVKGYQTFRSVKDAKKVANLIVEKIRNRISPQISVEELAELGVVFSDQ